MNFPGYPDRRKELHIWRILLIDDDEDDFVLVRQMLAEAREGKFILEWVPSFYEGLSALAADRSYDAVIVDYDMGCHTGIELVRAANERGYPAPILLLTGRGTYEVDLEAMEAGAADYLSKGEMNSAFLERALRYAIERKKASVEREQLLSEQRQQREFLERLVDHAPIAIAVVEGEDLRYRMVNPAYQAIVGPQVQLVGRTFREIFPEAAERGMEANMRGVLRTGEPWSLRDFQTPILGRDALTWWEGETIPIPDGDGEVNALLILTWEITERKTAEDALRASEERERIRVSELETLMDAVPAMIWISRDSACREMTGNQQGYEFLRMWLGANISKTAPEDTEKYQTYRNFKDGREIPNEALPMQRAAAEGISIQGYEYDLVFADGSEYRLLGNVNPLFDLSGKPSGAVGAFIDLTARRKTEQLLHESEVRYRTLFDTMLNGFAVHEIICDPDGNPVDYRFLEINPAFEQLTGLKADQIIGKTVREVLPDIDPVWIETYGKVALRGEPVQFEHLASPIGYSYQVYAYCPQPGQFATVFSNITDRKRAEHALRESEERFRALFNNRHSVMLLVDPETAQIVDANPAACSFYGWSREALIQMKVTDINTLPVEQAFQKMSQAQSVTTSAIFQFQHRLASGEIRDVAVHSGPIQIHEKQYLFSIIHDVTEHKKAQKSWKDSEVRYRTFFDNLQETVTLFEVTRDAQGQITDAVFADVNAVWLQLMGLERSQVIGKRASEIFDADLLQRYTAAYSQVLSTGKPLIHESNYLGRHMLVTVFRMNENMVATTGIDISERKQMEADLRQAHDRAAWLARFPEDNPNPVARVSAEGQVLYINPVAKHLPEWNCRVNETLQEPLMALVQAAMDQKQEVVQDVALGEKFYSVSVMPFLEDRYANLYGRDVTARRNTETALRETEERFRVALANSSVAVFSTDRDLRYTWFYSNVMGTLPEQFIGKRDDEILPAENVAPLMDLKKRVAMQKTALREEIILDIGKSKEVMIASIEPFLDQDGELLGVTGSLFDITEQRRLELEIIEHHTEIEVQRRLSEYREKERQEIAHDLHDGPVQDLSSLIFSIQFTKEAIQDPTVTLELEQVRARLKTTVQDLRGMINDLRPPSLIRFGVVKAIQFHAEDFREKHPELSIELSLNALEGNMRLPEQLNLNVFRIYQEAMNNIARHAQATKVHVHLEQIEDKIRLEVRDNGKGFSLSEGLIDHTHNNHYGLAGMKERTGAIGGELWVSSALGEGTSVRLEVPLPEMGSES